VAVEWRGQGARRDRVLDEGEATAGLRGAEHEADTEGAEVDEFAVSAADHPRAV
jgi:hypothetical protein